VSETGSELCSVADFDLNSIESSENLI